MPFIAKAWARSIMRTSQRKQKTNTAKQLVSWKPPPPGWLKLNTDGAVLPSSMEASSGGVIRNANGEWIKGYTRSIGCTTVLQSELWAILEGLHFAWEMGHNFIVESNSASAVHILNSNATPHDSAIVQRIRSYTDLHWNMFPELRTASRTRRRASIVAQL
ncbi:uncharacterized protein LOC120143251 [Hibiscus syriacus]|uniref:uncharacterized protein LOC120143251 n=1 Tax=Hibiscus syriacus TaxID=106335 RepID=UPI0019207B13|nr:uncharacterized protein LOC120143251 [Hibiscus syriacus]